MKLYVLVPCFNEIKTINKILQRLIKLKKNIKIILIDDGSTDGTKEFIQKNIKKKIYKFIDLKKNYGKGYAINRAKKFVKSDSLVIIQDADLEYNVKDLIKIFNFLRKNKNIKVVYGSRFVGSEEKAVLFFWHRVGNFLLTTFSNMLTNLNLTDMEVGYKAFKSEILKKIDLKENRFGFEPEITAKIAKMNLNIYEVGIKYYGRSYKEGKK